MDGSDIVIRVIAPQVTLPASPDPPAFSIHSGSRNISMATFIAYGNSGREHQAKPYSEWLSGRFRRRHQRKTRRNYTAAISQSPKLRFGEEKAKTPLVRMSASP
jgi:hypothetical protein